MAKQHRLSLILLGLCVSTQIVKCTSVCSIGASVALCIDKGLQEVPELPTHVNKVDLSNNSIAELNETSFSLLDGLQALILMHQKPGLVIRNNTFRGLANLTSLQLDYNHFLKTETGAFNGLSNLEILTLTQCSLDDAILSGDFLKPLVSLEMLDLRENNIQRIQPASFFLNMRRFHWLDLSRNKVKSICEEELLGFQGKHFTLLKLSSVRLQDMNEYWLGWDKCGNPFKNMSITQLDLSGNGFTVNMAKRFFNAITGTKIQSLILSNSYSMGKSSVDPNLFSGLHYLSLMNNDFRCDCKLRDFQTWLNQTNVTIFHPIEDVTCASPEDQFMLPVVRSNIQCEDEEEERRSEKLRLVLFILCFALIILLTASAIIYVRRRGYIFKLYKNLTGKLVNGNRKEPDPDRFLYDVYLCFSSSDMKWVERALLNRLDSQFSEQNTLRCCFEERDFIPGEDHLTNMRNAIQNSHKTLCVVSERFLKDGWCLETFTLAQCRMLVELKDILVVLVVGNIPQYRLLKYEQLRSYIENRRYLLWPDDNQDLEWFYDQLLHKIRKNTKVKQTNTEVNEFERNLEEANVLVDTAV
ncbi:hypothetical protein R3I93_012264 [Phoxinus phoxinus]|uniref:TIR domain-containing protein n=1 Tax=Phoxinus phoxinus TaxID=58324 RepID=A0AAN9D1S0_9TELE